MPRPPTRSRGFFDDGSPYLRHPLLTVERTVGEVDRIETILRLGPNATVLDVGCGFGRHSIELARRGYRVTGIDPSSTMVEAATAAASEAGLDPGVDVRFEVGTGQGLPDRRNHDGAIAMFTTVGQVDASGDDNVDLLASVAGTLRPGGIFLVEVPQREWAVANLVEHDRFGDGPATTVIDRRYDPSARRVMERFEVGTPGDAVTYDLAYRLFDADELGDLLVDAGFSSLVVSGSLAGLATADPPPIGPDDAGIFIAASSR